MGLLINNVNELKMNDLEFILANAGIDINDMTNDQIQWINKVLIPYWNRRKESLLEHIIIPSRTFEIRKYKPSYIASLLKTCFQNK